MQVLLHFSWRSADIRNTTALARSYGRIGEARAAQGIPEFRLLLTRDASAGFSKEAALKEEHHEDDRT
jgi:hypothetical protein